jgi:hypothetical protein
MWGMLSSVFTTTMFTANRVATNISSRHSAVCICSGWCNNRFRSLTQITRLTLKFSKMGIVFLLNYYSTNAYERWIPTGIGLGSIVSALELPVSVMMPLSIKRRCKTYSVV